jgi:pSer/pThr/pTyr-binding forkhead associated (FHA) protein
MPLRLRMIPAAGQAGKDQGPSAERAIEFAEGTDEVRIGRRADVELPLPFPALSGLHARLTRSSDGWRIEDLGSTNGTRVDGERLAPGNPRPIAPGAQVVLGEVTLIFDGEVSPVLGAEGTATIARRLVSDLFAAAPGTATPTLSIVSGVPGRPALRLEDLERRYLAGRVETCDLQLLSDEISREHAAFVRRWDGVVVKDLGSKNGILVNEAPVVEQRLHDGDLVRIGPALLRISDPADRYLRDFEGRAAPRAAEDGEAGGPSGAALSDLQQQGVPVAAPAIDTRPLAEPAPPSLPPSARRSSGSRTAMAVGAVVLLIVGAVILILALG